MLSTSPKQTETHLADLSACENEPIHLPGAIEPNGSILVVSEAELIVLQASSNTLSFLGLAPGMILGKHLEEVFPDSDVKRFADAGREEGKRRYISQVRPKHGEFLLDGLAHRRQGMLIIEVEACSPRPENNAAGDIYESLTDAVAALDGTLPLPVLCERIAIRIRALTGFDRVMVYRFLQDGCGAVIAEDRRPDLVPYLGLRFPASDIPAQARRLYLVNMLRLKADVNAKRAVMIPAINPQTGLALDMTFCILRAMSPVHDEYLRNMGVAASLSISIIKEGRLWGLIACHHTRPRLVPHATRITCEVLGRVFSSQIATAEEVDRRTQDTALLDLNTRIGVSLSQDRDVVSTLTSFDRAIRAVIGAHGCAYSVRGRTGAFGTTPNTGQMESLIDWLAANQQKHVLTSERLVISYPQADEFVSSGAGMMSIRIALDGPDFIVWFRPPAIQVVTWAGNPDKPVEESEAGKRISPRRSFELWRQTSSDSSESWTEAEIDFASALRPIIAETMLTAMNAEILRLNLELARSNVELDSFAYAASHDLQEPVRGIRAYAQLLDRRVGKELPPEARGFLTTIATSAGRMEDLITSLLSYSQLGGTERRESKPVNLEKILRWVLTNLDETIRKSGATVTYADLPVILGDFDHMVRLLQNLISNSIKYRRPDVPSRIHLSSHWRETALEVCVVDNGEGFDPHQSTNIFEPFKRLHGREVTGNGIGLATCKRIVEIHEGQIWAESQGPNCGATFRFTLPLSRMSSVVADRVPA